MYRIPETYLEALGVIVNEMPKSRFKMTKLEQSRTFLLFIAMRVQIDNGTY